MALRSHGCNNFIVAPEVLSNSNRTSGAAAPPALILALQPVGLGQKRARINVPRCVIHPQTWTNSPEGMALPDSLPQPPTHKPNETAMLFHARSRRGISSICPKCADRRFVSHGIAVHPAPPEFRRAKVRRVVKAVKDDTIQKQISD